MTSSALLSLAVAASLSAQAPQPAATAFERLKSLEGEWIDVDGAFGAKGAVAATYEVSGAGNTVIETFPVGTPGEIPPNRTSSSSINVVCAASRETTASQ